jgi:transcriptional regulator with XRE-family HTH domain
MTALEELGKEIALERKKHRLRQSDVAAKAQVSRATIDAIENGRAAEIGYSKLTRILAVLGLELRLAPGSSRRPTLEELLEERADDD